MFTNIQYTLIILIDWFLYKWTYLVLKHISQILPRNIFFMLQFHLSYSYIKTFKYRVIIVNVFFIFINLFYSKFGQTVNLSISLKHKLGTFISKILLFEVVSHSDQSISTITFFAYSLEKAS